MQKQCELCAAVFTARTRKGMVSRFCSCVCRNRATAKKLHDNFIATAARSECPVCKTIFLPKDKRFNKFCSRECSVKFKAARKPERFRKDDLGIAPVHIGKYTRVLISPCKHCGKVFARKSQRAFCSPECSWRFNYNKNEKRPEVEVEKECSECGSNFKTINSRRLYCSVKCSNKQITRSENAKTRRRKMRLAKQRGEPIRLHEIARRDKFTCGICGHAVDMSIKHPHRYSPSIDHIIPICAGGSHTKANVRLTHMICNSIKGGTLDVLMGVSA